MLINAIKKFSLLAFMCSCASAAPIYLGFVEFRAPAGGGPPSSFNEFWIKNWTDGVAGTFGLSTRIVFTEISLRIDYDEGANSVTNEEAWRTGQPSWLFQPIVPAPPDPRTAEPDNDDYRMLVPFGKNIKKAVFSVKLSNTGPWTLANGGAVVTPGDPNLDSNGVFTMEMLPKTAPYFQPGPTEAWAIALISEVPEPMTIALTGLGLAGIILVRRRQRA